MSQQSILQWFQKADNKGEDERIEEAVANNSNEKRKAHQPEEILELEDYEDDDFCIILDDPPSTSLPTEEQNTADQAIAGLLVSDDLQIVGASHPNALMDFPHSRQDCVAQHSSAYDYCHKCYCYVCDIKASECQAWQSHCQARKGVFLWESMRRQERRKRTQAKTTTTTIAAAAATTTQDSDPDAALAVLDLFGLPFSEQMRLASTPARVSPSSAAQGSAQQRRRSPAVQRPTKRSKRRRDPPPPTPYKEPMQVATTEQVIRPAAAAAASSADPTSVDSILRQVSKNYLGAVLMPPKQQRFQSTLYPYQRQSLAFMQSVEEQASSSSSPSSLTTRNDFGSSSSSSSSSTKGGWLASEVGMGKTAIILALVASDTSHVAKDDWSRPKTTVVLTSASLMGQWEDEVKKHAPNLTVRRFHSSSSRSKHPIDLHNWDDRLLLTTTDIIISTATFEWPSHVVNKVKFHRVVMDEAHLLSNTTNANIGYATRIQADCRWCVTATPLTAGISDLKQQMTFLGIQDNSPFGRAFSNATINNESIDAFVNMFAKYVTRHEKSQMVDGRQAVELPNKVGKVVFLHTSPDEKSQYQRNLQNLNWNQIRKYERDGASKWGLEQGLIHPLSSDKLLSSSSSVTIGWKDSTKICALYNEIKQLWSSNSNIRAVIFTQYTNTHALVVQALKALFGIPVVYEITGSTSTTNRDFAIRAFQGPKKFPACMVVTLGAGSVGMTLTQASHLFLMEPCLDSAAETQAMGRIDRLGQTSEMVMKKFVFSDTIEANMVALHSEIVNGRGSVNKSKISAAGVKILTRGLANTP
ncbi:unnamed protein product [Cylindrotheca closterium]|uniref:Helicase ATP-binding domain-containing protein n=1 Tax=Cylindrotheca closterium TaxID=2856 RepID=A0AAD2G155_9STRA|nr:unnamed protein product [Cylindrotheca closterium]